MKVLLHHPHEDGEGCPYPKPPELTAVLYKMDMCVMDLDAAMAQIQAAVGADCDVKAKRDSISVSVGPFIVGKLRQNNYRAINYTMVEP